MRWMMYTKYTLAITSIILGSFVAVCLANNCYASLKINPPDDLPDAGVSYEDNTVFPCKVGDTELIALSLLSYEGTFPEDGGDSEVSAVAALMLRNNTDEHIYNAQIKVKQGERTLVFELTHLPGNEEILVVEKNKQHFKGDTVWGCDGVVRFEEGSGWTERVLFTPTGQRSLIARNLTERPLKDVVVYYKTYYEPAGFYVGGITYSIQIDAIAQNEEVQLFPCPFVVGGSAVVWVALDE